MLFSELALAPSRKPSHREGDAPAGPPPAPMLSRTSTFSRPLLDDEYATMSSQLKGIVQCFTNSVWNDWQRPWSRATPEASTGSGFVISTCRRLIITNAHVVAFASTLQVRKDGDFDKHVAQILAVSHQTDLAIVTVASDAFWLDAIELPLGETPRLQQHVDVVGFPIGGNSVSITSGVVSRINWSVYSQSREANLVVTVDTAINNGNSGGPAMSDGHVVGVAFQSPMR